MGSIVSDMHDAVIVSGSSSMDIALNDDLFDTFRNRDLQQVNTIQGALAPQERQIEELMTGAVLSVVYLLDRLDRRDMPGADI